MIDLTDDAQHRLFMEAMRIRHEHENRQEELTREDHIAAREQRKIDDYDARQDGYYPPEL